MLDIGTATIGIGKTVATIMQKLRDKRLQGERHEEFKNLINEAEKNIQGKISKKINDNLIQKIKASKVMLLDAINASTKQSQIMSLQSANAILTELIELPPTETTEGSYEIIDNKNLISWGYLGRFLYFILLGDLNNALRQVYQCSHKYPELGIYLFPSIFFPTINIEELKEIVTEAECIQTFKGLPDSSIYKELPKNQAKALLEMRTEPILEKLNRYCQEALNEIEVNPNLQIEIESKEINY